MLQTCIVCVLPWTYGIVDATQDAVAAVRQFIATTDSIRFNLMALTTPQVFG